MNLPTEDWDELFVAIETKLRLCADEASDVAQLRRVVLECVGDLDGLHRALRDERHLYRPMAVEVAGLREHLTSHDPTRTTA